MQSILFCPCVPCADIPLAPLCCLRLHSASQCLFDWSSTDVRCEPILFPGLVTYTLFGTRTCSSISGFSLWSFSIITTSPFRRSPSVSASSSFLRHGHRGRHEDATHTRHASHAHRQHNVCCRVWRPSRARKPCECSCWWQHSLKSYLDTCLGKVEVCQNRWAQVVCTLFTLHQRTNLFPPAERLAVNLSMEAPLRRCRHGSNSLSSILFQAVVHSVKKVGKLNDHEAWPVPDSRSAVRCT